MPIVRLVVHHRSLLLSVCVRQVAVLVEGLEMLFNDCRLLWRDSGRNGVRPGGPRDAFLLMRLRRALVLRAYLKGLAPGVGR